MNTVRRRVVGPGEEIPSDDFYLSARGSEDSRLPQNKTALREAERKFKGSGWEERVEKEAIDFSRPDSDERIIRLENGAFGVKGYPGFVAVPAALSMEEQKYWLERAFSEYMRPPQISNLDALYDGLPQEGLYNTGLDVINLRKSGSKDQIQFDREKLLRKIRWVTLGYQYDWTSKEYDFAKDPVPFPPELAEYCRKVCARLGFGHDYRAEAGIVNYYQTGDTLTSHVDRSERNMEAPLLSMSLGSSCIFLLGGSDRDDPVVPIILRSGDINILSGPSRTFFHGVPRIIPESTPSELVDSCPAIRSARININIRQVT